MEWDLGWVVLMLGVVVFMLWWIRWALEPMRDFYQRRLDAKEMKALDADLDRNLRESRRHARAEHEG